MIFPFSLGRKKTCLHVIFPREGKEKIRYFPSESREKFCYFPFPSSEGKNMIYVFFTGKEKNYSPYGRVKRFFP
ncbi:hypothetical protein B5E82_09965 [Lachnoclostridium sp. An138]|nr:hypothetical protein B5E82_09965 [Lachnoclostridium sp. An138]